MSIPQPLPFEVRSPSFFAQTALHEAHLDRLYEKNREAFDSLVVTLYGQFLTEHEQPGDAEHREALRCLFSGEVYAGLTTAPAYPDAIQGEVNCLAALIGFHLRNEVGQGWQAYYADASQPKAYALVEDFVEFVIFMAFSHGAAALASDPAQLAMAQRVSTEFNRGMRRLKKV